MMMNNMQVFLTVTLVSLISGAQAHAQSGEMIEQGHEIYDYWCLPCHGEPANPGDMIGTRRLQERYQDAVPALLEERTNMAPAFVESIVRNGISIMPFFRKTEISEEELDALSAYLTRNNDN